MRAFRLNLAQAEIFYTLCHELNADTEEKRLQIMDVLATLGQVEGITESSMSKDEYVKHIAKQFGTVLRVSPNMGTSKETQNGESTDSIGFKLPGDTCGGSGIPGDSAA